MSIYVLVAIVRKRLGLAASLYQALQIHRHVTLFRENPILCALQVPEADSNGEFAENVNQLILFDIGTVVIRNIPRNMEGRSSLM